MGSEPDRSTAYERLRAEFTVVEPTSKEEFIELISSVFAGDDYWANQDERHWVEYELKDPLKPIERFLEQKPSISRTAFAMSRADMEDRELMQYAEHALTRSRSHLLRVNYVAAWFFLRNFGLLPRCRYGSSKEKVLDLYRTPENVRDLTFPSLSPLFERGCREDFEETPIVFCGELRPSDLLERGQGFRSAAVFPYDCMEWDESRETCSVTAYLLEFPEPIAPVITPAELYERMRSYQDELAPSVDRLREIPLP